MKINYHKLKNKLTNLLVFGTVTSDNWVLNNIANSYIESIKLKNHFKKMRSIVPSARNDHMSIKYDKNNHLNNTKETINEVKTYLCDVKYDSFTDYYRMDILNPVNNKIITVDIPKLLPYIQFSNFLLNVSNKAKGDRFIGFTELIVKDILFSYDIIEEKVIFLIKYNEKIQHRNRDEVIKEIENESRTLILFHDILSSDIARSFKAIELKPIVEHERKSEFV